MIFEAFVDSALSGKNAELSFSCTELSFPKSGPNTPLAPNQMKMTTMAAQNRRRLGFLRSATGMTVEISDMNEPFELSAGRS